MRSKLLCRALRKLSRLGRPSVGVRVLVVIITGSSAGLGDGGENISRALRRAQYLLNASVPTDNQYATDAVSQAAYREAVRRMLNEERFYNVMMRYHEKIFGTGLKNEYLEELMREDIDNKQNKFARVMCQRSTGASSRFRCDWVSAVQKGGSTGCPQKQRASRFSVLVPGNSRLGMSIRGDDLWPRS